MLPKAALTETLDKDPLIARVNGVELRQSDLEIARQDLGRSIPEDFGEAKTRDYLVNYLADLIVMSDAAKKQKLGDESDLRRRMELTRKKTLRDNLLAATARSAATEAAVREAFDKAVRRVSAEPQLHIRSILFKFADVNDEAAVSAAEAKANVALDRLRKGENFATVAVDMSENPNNKLGGDMGYLSKFEMSKEYADVAYGLKDGELSPLIKTSFGWHIIRVDDRRDPPKVDFEKVRGRFEKFVAQTAQNRLVEKLRATEKIERLDKSPDPVETSTKTKVN